MTKGKQLLPEERNSRRVEIAHAAANLIFEKGFGETSVSVIATASGMGKSTFYEFFKSKDEIMLLLLDEPLGEIRTLAKEIANKDKPVIERISEIMHMHLEILMRDRAFIFRLGFEFQKLPMAVQAKHEVKRKAYQDILVGLIEEGIAEGSFRAVDADMVMKTLLSILSSVIMTPRPTDTPAGMLNKALDILFSGVNKN